MDKKKMYELYGEMVHQHGAEDICSRMLKKMLLAEENTEAKGGINLTDWLLRDKRDPKQILKGAFYKDGRIVATDAHVLIVLENQNYPEEFEGQVVSPDGDFIEGRFPKWECIIPDQKKMTEIKPDWAKVKSDLKEVKLGLGTRTSSVRYVNFDDKFCINEKYVPLLLKLQKSPGISRIMYQEGDPRRAILVVGPNYCAIFMPVIKD